MIDISLNPVKRLDATLDTGIFLEATLMPSADLVGYSLDHVENFDIGFSNSENLEIDLGEYPLYPGPYEAVSKCWRDQEFETRHRRMKDNFVVKEITYLEVKNSGGGITATIGEV